MINDLGLSFVEICKSTPGGVLAFFPSYSLMNRVLETWEKSKIDKDIERYKTLLVEPKESAHYPHVISSFYNDVYSKGSVMLGVWRGKIAEGLDFSDDAARAVVVIGVPYPLKTDPKTIMKQYYLDKIRSISNKGISSQAWFLMQATRATNQAIGRVIRHAEDYGNIILIDERFSETKHKVSTSAWLRDQLQEFEDFREAISEYEKFYSDMKEKQFIPKVDKLEKLSLEFHEQDNEYFKKIKDKIQEDAAARFQIRDTKKIKKIEDKKLIEQDSDIAENLKQPKEEIQKASKPKSNRITLNLSSNIKSNEKPTKITKVSKIYSSLSRKPKIL